MDKLLKYLEKNNIKYVRDNSVFPGKYNYLFYKAGFGSFVEFHNLSDAEISRKDYQDIIIKKLKKVFASKLHVY